MAIYGNGKRISGIRDFPAYTWAEYHALPVAQRPKVWKCTDRDYTEIPVENVTFTPQSNVTINSDRSHVFKSGKLCFVQLWITTSSAVTDVVKPSGIIAKYDWTVFSLHDCTNDTTARKLWARYNKGTNTIQIYTSANTAPSVGTYFINGVIALE